MHLPAKAIFTKLFQASFVLLIVCQLFLSILLLRNSCYASVVDRQVLKSEFTISNAAVLNNCLSCTYDKDTPFKQEEINANIPLMSESYLFYNIRLSNDASLVSNLSNGINPELIDTDIRNNIAGINYELDAQHLRFKGSSVIKSLSHKYFQYQSNTLITTVLDHLQPQHLMSDVESTVLAALLADNEPLLHTRRFTLPARDIGITLGEGLSSEPNIVPATKLAFSELPPDDMIVINTECVYLDEMLGGDYPTISIQCGFLPGDTKKIHTGAVISAFERAGLATPRINRQFFTVHRQGKEISGDDVKGELEELYRSRYPDREIVIDNVKVGKGIFISPNDSQYFIVDLEKFGSATGTVNTGNTKHSFSYMVRVYEMAHVAIARIYKGDELDGVTSYERVETTYQRKEVVADIGAVIAERSISKGRVITVDMVSTKPERRRGDTIILIYHDGDIKLEIMGVAEGDAVVGKSFPVRNPSSGKVLNAIYQGDGKAVVH